MTDEKKDWVSEVVGSGVKIETATNIDTKPAVAKTTANEDVKGATKEVSLSQEKTKSKKVMPAEKTKVVKLFLDGKLDTYDVDEKLPEGFLMSKLKENQRYIPIHLYREIMRQIGEYGVPEFTDPEKFLSGKNKSSVDMVTYRIKCRLVWNKPGMKEPIILAGVGYSSMSAGVLLSDAVHGNIATLEAKALRSVLKHSYRIFEFPELDVVDTGEQGQINELKAKETIKNIVDNMQTNTSTVAPMPATTPVQSTENTSIQQEIIEDYHRKKEVMFAQLVEIQQVVEKKHVLLLAKEVKDKFGEEYKSFISKIIRDDFNSAK